MGFCFLFRLNFLAAYKHADGKKIDGKRVLVDVERARTVKGWLPRRLGKHKNISNQCITTKSNIILFMNCILSSAGGGLGGTRRGGPDVNIKHSGREDNERERERYRLEREREDRRPDFRDRGDRFNRRSRSPRIRERERERRSRSRDRKKRRSRSRDDSARRDRDNRDRSDRREKEKKRKRSRSRDRERAERKRDKRDKERDHRDRKERKPDFRAGDIKIKEEPVDGE